MINSFSGYGYDRDAGATNAKLLASSGVALADSNMGLFDRAGFATVAVTADPLSAAARSIKRKILPHSPTIFSSWEPIVACDCRRARERVQMERATILASKW